MLGGKSHMRFGRFCTLGLPLAGTVGQLSGGGSANAGVVTVLSGLKSPQAIAAVVEQRGGAATNCSAGVSPAVAGASCPRPVWERDAPGTAGETPALQNLRAATTTHELVPQRSIRGSGGRMAIHPTV